MADDKTPQGDLTLRTRAMPADTNPAGDIFGGWLLAQMDIAGGIAAERRAQGRVVTVAIDAMVFHKPVVVGDVLSVYGELVRVGTTSLAYSVEAWVRRGHGGGDAAGGDAKVTEGVFTYVAIDAARRPRSVPTGA